MPLYNIPPADVRVLNRTSSLNMPIRQQISSNTSLPSDIVLRARGVRFDSFEPFPVIRSGEFFETQRGDRVVVKTKVQNREGIIEEREVTTVDVGLSTRAAIGVAQTETQEKAVQQATSETVSDTEVSVENYDAIPAVSQDPETIPQGEIEVTTTEDPNVLIVQEEATSYSASYEGQTNAEKEAAFLQRTEEQREKRRQNTVIIGPDGQTYNSPSQAIQSQPGYTPPGSGSGSRSSGPGRAQQGGGSRSSGPGRAQQGQTDEELILLQQQGLL